MSTRVTIRPHEYHDSVRLMQVSQQARQLEGVEEAILMMATDNNKKLLAAADLMTAEVEEAARDDLVIGIVAETDGAADIALEKVGEMLSKRSLVFAGDEHKSLESALEALGDANLALISIPGEYAAEETQRALEKGLNVMLFSDNVSLDDEVRLKRLASQAGLLLMGPDCGTAIVNGCGLGFANAVRRGSIGIVGASGTGIQEICVLLDRCGFGISHAIGTGGRDLKAQVGGLSMLMGIDLLTADPGTEVIVLASKPPDEEVAGRVLDKASRCGKPVVINFLGSDGHRVTHSNLVAAATLEEAAREAARLVTGDNTGGSSIEASEDALWAAAREQTRFLAPGQKYLRGLYSGGTLCYEAMLILQDKIGDIYSNIALSSAFRLHDPYRSRKHTLLDLGDDVFTQGQAHPMIDPTLRNQRLIQEAEHADVAVILLDVVMGYGSHASPCRQLTDSIELARERAGREDRHLIIIATVCGTEGDPQGLSTQEKLLQDAGVIVATSNAQASRLAGCVVDTAQDSGIRT